MTHTASRLDGGDALDRSGNTDYERSTFQSRACYRYIRRADGLPVRDEHAIDPLARVRLFNPTGAGTWYIAEYDPETRTAYGLAVLDAAELGYFSMAELVSFRGDFGLPIERDLHWKPRRLSECRP
jgi:hypothetical protein